jgi:hypothetical protein
MRLMRAAFAAAATAGLVVAVGCGGGDQTGEVTGMVTLDGTPVETGAITFTPADGKSPTAGAAIEAGKYTARVPAGPAKVVINGSKVVGKKALYGPGSPERPVYAELLPEKYNEKSDVTYEVKPGAQEKNWELSSK